MRTRALCFVVGLGVFALACASTSSVANPVKSTAETGTETRPKVDNDRTPVGTRGSKSSPGQERDEDTTPVVEAHSADPEPTSKRKPAGQSGDSRKERSAGQDSMPTPVSQEPESEDKQPVADIPEIVLPSFEPSSDGFGFVNFSGGTGASSVLIDDLVDLFGTDGLCIPNESDSCLPYPGVSLFLEQLNEVLANGLCYGISAATTNHFSGAIDLGGITTEVVNVVDLQRSEQLEHSIASLHMMQFSEEYREFLDIYMEMNPEQIAKSLLDKFGALENKLIPPYTLALYSDYGGHSITPTRVDEVEDGYRIFVYDSNWPRETRWVDIDRDTSAWSYQAVMENRESEEELWVGQGPGSMTLIPHERPDNEFNCFSVRQERSTQREIPDP